MRWWFSMSFKSILLPYTIINFLFASLKLLTNFENVYWNPPQNFLLCDWSMFSSADLLLVSGKCTGINLSRAASGMIVQNHRLLPVSIFSVKIAAVGSLNRVPGRIFKFSKLFQRSKLKLLFWLLFLIFSSTRKQNTAETISAYILL